MQSNLPFPRKIKIEKKKTNRHNKNTHYNPIHHFHEEIKFQKEQSLETKKKPKYYVEAKKKKSPLLQDIPQSKL